MKPVKFKIFRRIATLVFLITALMGVSFIIITYFASTHFYEAGTQLLNKDVAAHIAKFSSPFEGKKIDKQKADSVFFDAMVLSPNIEIYFLDTAGNVLHYYKNNTDVKLLKVPLNNIKQYIADSGKQYIKSIDPRDPDVPKVFSAAEVKSHDRKLGYIYVVLASKEYRTTSAMLFSSHVLSLILKAVILIIIISVTISLLYLYRIKKRLKAVLSVLERFQQGDYAARFSEKENDDLSPLTQSFNKMADLLVFNINKLVKSEKERKDIIANISHDLRTPLAIARGYAETLFIKKQNPEITAAEEEEYTRLILANIKQMENLVLQLFELAKMESVAFEPKKEPFIFAEIVHEIIANHHLFAAEKNIHIDCSRCTDFSWVLADIGMMESVIQNLLVNAIAYTPANEQIVVAVERTDNTLIFQIENEGKPLSENMVQWLNTANGKHTDKPLKFSIGLTIVKKILDIHQFPLSVKTHTAHGNLFSFTMPVHRVHTEK